MTVNKKYENGLFIFRRDLRIVDNNGLNLLSDNCKNLFTIFIFTPEQVSSSNKYKSDNAVQFMIESLYDLSHEISQKGGKLITFYEDNDFIVNQFIKKFNIDIVGFNLDCSPYAIKRDKQIMDLCHKLNKAVLCDHDYYLHEPGTILTGSNTPYKKFTPYYQVAIKKTVATPKSYKKINFDHGHSNKHKLTHEITLEEAMKKFTIQNDNILVHGGRTNGIQQMKEALKTQKHCDVTRNEMDKKTTELSAYIKFGCISIREVYKYFKPNHGIVRQLIWRDFYANILYSFPYVLGHAMKPNYDKIKWHQNTRLLNAWKTGKTGFPIVDAGMRQLNTTGYMHNRGRLITASFLVKTLLISWEHGEKYFATRLTDYDPASNNGNWQWIASTGADSQPFFRIFNPWEQTKNYDPTGEYIKKWIPELRDVPVKDLMNWDTSRISEQYIKIKYPEPIVDYKKQKELALKMYGAVFS